MGVLGTSGSSSTFSMFKVDRSRYVLGTSWDYYGYSVSSIFRSLFVVASSGFSVRASYFYSGRGTLWAKDFGFSLVRGRSIISVFQVRSGFSFARTSSTSSRL